MEITRDTFLFMLCGGAMTLGCFFHLIGMATPYWMHLPMQPINDHYGLWQECYYSQCEDIAIGSRGSRYDASRAFAVLGLLTGVGTAACLFLGQYAYSNKRSQLRLAALCTAIATVVCLIINIATFVDYVQLAGRQYLSWSFALSATGLTLCGVATALIGALILTDHRADYSST